MLIAANENKSNVVGQDERDLGAVRESEPRRHERRGGKAKRDGAAANVDHRVVDVARIGDAGLCCEYAA